MRENFEDGHRLGDVWFWRASSTTSVADEPKSLGLFFRFSKMSLGRENPWGLCLKKPPKDGWGIIIFVLGTRRLGSHWEQSQKSWLWGALKLNLIWGSGNLGEEAKRIILVAARVCSLVRYVWLKWIGALGKMNSRGRCSGFLFLRFFFLLLSLSRKLKHLVGSCLFQLHLHKHNNENI